MLTNFRYYGRDVVIYEPTVTLRAEVISIGDGTRIDSFVKLEGGLQLVIGERVHIASFCHINTGGGAVAIGNEVALSSGVKICGGMSDLDYPSGSPVSEAGRSAGKRGSVVILPRAILFANAVVLPGVTIGEGAIIAAGSVVTRDVPAGEVWAGVPARFLRKR